MKKFNIIASTSAVLVLITTAVAPAVANASEVNQSYNVTSEQSTSSIQPVGVNKIVFDADTSSEYASTGLSYYDGTYIKNNKNGYTVYLNSAIVRIAAIAGSAAIMGQVGALVEAAGLATSTSTTITSAISGVLAAIPTSRGIWIHFDNFGNVRGFGQQ